MPSLGPVVEALFQVVTFQDQSWVRQLHPCRPGRSVAVRVPEFSTLSFVVTFRIAKDAGRVDGEDASKFVIPFEIDGKPGVIVGRLNDYGSIDFTVPANLA